jgi:hypothetical protein
MFYKDMKEYYYIVCGWSAYYYRTYILGVGVGFFSILHNVQYRNIVYVWKIRIV